MAARPDALIPHAPNQQSPPAACGSASEHVQAIDEGGGAASASEGSAVSVGQAADSGEEGDAASGGADGVGSVGEGDAPQAGEDSADSIGESRAPSVAAVSAATGGPDREATVGTDSAASGGEANATSSGQGSATSGADRREAGRRPTRERVAPHRKRRQSGREHVARRRNAILWTAKALLWVACLVPLGLLVWWGTHDQLTANPIEKITHWTGRWTLALLLVTLAVTPIRRLTGWNRVIRVRRLIGLFAFFYGILHFLTYLVVDQFFAWGFIAEDILERPYITLGFTGFVLLIPLAATSTKGMIRRLGGKRWQRLHRLIYVTAILGVVHFLWSVKADTRDPLIFGAVLLVLLALRLQWKRRRNSMRRQRAGS